MTETNDPYFMIRKSELDEFCKEYIPISERGWKRICAIRDACLARGEVPGNAVDQTARSLQELLIDQKKLCDKCNAAYGSITIGRVSCIDGWDARVTVAAPGILDEGEPDD